MHFFKTKTRLKKSRVTLVAAVILSAVSIAGGSMMNNNSLSPLNQTVLAKKQSSKNSKKTKTVKKAKPKKKTSKSKKATKLAKTPMSSSSDADWGDFTIHKAGTKQVGSAFGNIYFQFHTKNVKSVPSGGKSSAWHKVKHYGDSAKSDISVYEYDVPVRKKPNDIKLKKNQRPSILYKNIATMYHQSGDKGFIEKPQKIDIRLTLVGYYNSDSKYNEIYFYKNKIRAAHHGWNVKAVYALQFYKAGTTTPINFSSTPLSFWDIDGPNTTINKTYKQSDTAGGQGINVTKPNGKPIYNVTGSNNKGTGYPAIRPGYLKSGRERESLFGTPNNYHPKWSAEQREKEGTVTVHDVGGGITFMVPQEDTATGTILANFTAAQHRNWMNSTNRVTLNSQDLKSIANTSKVSPSSKNHVTSPGNMFAVGQSNVMAPGMGPKFRHDKLVKKSEPTKPKGWSEKLDGLTYNKNNPSATSFYYRFLISSSYPKALKTKKDAMVVAHDIQMQDKEIDTGLDIDTSWNKENLVSKVAFYTQDMADAPMKKVSSSDVKRLFKITWGKKNGKRTLNIKLKKDITDEDLKGKNAKHYKWLFNHDISIIFKVKGNKNLINKFTKPLGNNKYEADLSNTALLTNEYTAITRDVWVRITTDRKQVPAKVTPAKGVKDVFKLKDGKQGDDKVVKDDDWDWNSYNYGAVMPGQYLTYTLHFTLKKPSTSADRYIKYTELHLTDNLDEKIDHINNLYMGTSRRSKKYKIDIDDPKARKIDVKLKEDKYKELFKKLDNEGGDLWFRYQAVLGDKKPADDNDKVYNQAELEPTVKGIKRATFYAIRHYDDHITRNGKTITIHRTDNPQINAWNNSKISKELDDIYGNGAGNEPDMKKYPEGKYTYQNPTSAKWGNLNVPKSQTPTAKTNKTENPYTQPTPHETTKEYKDNLSEDKDIANLKAAGWKEVAKDSKSDENGDYDDSTVTRYTTGEFIVKFSPGILNQDLGDVPKQVLFEDKVDPNYFKVEGIGITDPNGNDITDWADFKSYNNNDVRWQITNKDKLKKLDYSSDSNYTMHIKVKSVLGKNTKKEFTNTAYAHYWEPYEINQKSNTLKLDHEEDDQLISKGITSIYDETTNKDWDASQPLAANHKYKIHYSINASLGNTADLSHFTITDSLPEHTSLVGDPSVSTDKGEVYGKQKNYDNSLVDDLKLQTYSQGNLGDGFTISGGGDKFLFSNIHVEYDVEVQPEADWSDYYNSTVNTQAGPASGLISYNNNTTNKVTDVSAIGVPNVVTLTTGDGDSQMATAPFYVQAQTFKAEQYIVQDDDAWSFNLDPSHYLPHTRNDKSAVTTAVRVRMPNYLKINQVQFENEAKSAGFDKGESHILRVNNKAARAPWGDPTKLGIPK